MASAFAGLVFSNTTSMAVRGLHAWRFARIFCTAHCQRETRAGTRRTFPPPPPPAQRAHAGAPPRKRPVIVIGLARARRAGQRLTRFLSRFLSRRVIYPFPLELFSRRSRETVVDDDVLV